MENLLEQINEARLEALRKGIEANTLLINERLGYCKTMYFKFSRGGNSFMTLPPMVLGLEIRRVDFLPDNVVFAVTSMQTERERIYNDGYYKGRQEMIDQLNTVSLAEISKILNPIDDGGTDK